MLAARTALRMRAPAAARSMAGITVPHADVRGAKVGGGAGAAFSSPDSEMDGARYAPGAGDEKRAFTYFVLVRARAGARALRGRLARSARARGARRIRARRSFHPAAARCPAAAFRRAARALSTRRQRASQ